jgi:hypothetical protein
MRAAQLMVRGGRKLEEEEVFLSLRKQKEKKDLIINLSSYLKFFLHYLTDI